MIYNQSLIRSISFFMIPGFLQNQVRGKSTFIGINKAACNDAIFHFSGRLY